MPRSKQTVKERNEELARAINEEALANPDSPFAHKFVAIADGKVVAVGDEDDVDELIRKLGQVEPDPQKTMLIEAGTDWNEVVEIWSLG